MSDKAWVPPPSRDNIGMEWLVTEQMNRILESISTGKYNFATAVEGLEQTLMYLIVQDKQYREKVKGLEDIYVNALRVYEGRRDVDTSIMAKIDSITYKRALLKYGQLVLLLYRHGKIRKSTQPMYSE